MGHKNRREHGVDKKAEKEKKQAIQAGQKYGFKRVAAKKKSLSTGNDLGVNTTSTKTATTKKTYGTNSNITSNIKKLKNKRIRKFPLH